VPYRAASHSKAGEPPTLHQEGSGGSLVLGKKIQAHTSSMNEILPDDRKVHIEIGNLINVCLTSPTLLLLWHPRSKSDISFDTIQMFLSNQPMSVSWRIGLIHNAIVRLDMTGS
jgi:hypothetical protein